MKRIGITGLILALTFAASAMTASSAMAFRVQCLPTVEPEWGNFNSTCTSQGAKQGFVTGMILSLGDRVGPGEYCIMVLPGFTTNVKGWTTLAGCINNEPGTVSTGALFTRVKDQAEENTGGTAKSEFKVLPSGKKINGVIGESTLGVGTFESITCESGSDGGEITSMDSIGKIVISLSGCKAHNEKSETCTIKSLGAGAGEIVTKTLRGLLGTAKASETVSLVAALIEPEVTKVIAGLAETPCSVESSLEGSVAAEINPVKALVLDTEFAFELLTGKQAIKQVSVLTGTRTPKLVAYGESATEQAIDEIEFEGEVEIA
jgi:hypothetical protein